ncbi:GNAT family N-acetyltransferase [Paraburkholderia bryophila]|uniref:GNAT family N-acetyltransferase n=1 Tax=Burkholderiaceae TaxID=119060 RepID=UPI000550449E|nr:GNAT family N-acetyltransferase [Burkholderia sp. 9120]
MSGSIQATLERVIWTALTTRQAHLGQGDALARRYLADVAPFAALADETPAAYQALHALLQPHEQVALLSQDELSLIDALQATRLGLLHRMVATRAAEAGSDSDAALDMIRLGHADTDEMLELVQKTKPGPFGKRTPEMGNYIGMRDGGRLIAMAGERMRIDGYVEISAVCVDENWRGKGLAGRLIQILRGEIERRGETPFLHVFSENRSAISLYERLGFEVCGTFVLTRVGRAESGSAGA